MAKQALPAYQQAGKKYLLLILLIAIFVARPDFNFKFIN